MMNRRQFAKVVLAITSLPFMPKQLKTWAAGLFFAIPPTIHHVTDTKATLYLRVSELTSDALLTVYDENDEVFIEQSLSNIDFRQKIVLEGLSSQTQYRCKFTVDGVEIGTFDDDSWSNLRFKTGPYNLPIKVVAIGDTGFGDQRTVQLANHMAQQEFDLFFTLGDLAYWQYQYDNDHFYNWYAKYFKPFADILRRIPHYPTMGNHAYDAAAFLDDLPSYHWIFPPYDEGHEGLRYWYTFHAGDIQFISINSQLIYSNVQLRNAQTEWLEEQLAREDSIYKVIFFHIAPYNSSAVHQWDGLPIVEQWVPLLEEGNVKMVLTGHSHLYERLENNGIHYIVAGAGSATVYNEGERLGISKYLYTDTSYPLIEFHEDHIHVTAFDVDGNILEDVDLSLD